MSSCLIKRCLYFHKFADDFLSASSSAKTNDFLRNKETGIEKEVCLKVDWILWQFNWIYSFKTKAKQCCSLFQKH